MGRIPVLRFRLHGESGRTGNKIAADVLKPANIDFSQADEEPLRRPLDMGAEEIPMILQRDEGGSADGGVAALKKTGRLGEITPSSILSVQMARRMFSSGGRGMGVHGLGRSRERSAMEP